MLVGKHNQITKRAFRMNRKAFDCVNVVENKKKTKIRIESIAKYDKVRSNFK